MLSVRSLATGLLVLVYLGVVGIPCPPQVAEPASRGERVIAGRAADIELASSRTPSHGNHGGHGDDAGANHDAHHAGSDEVIGDDEAHCHTPPQLLPRCPCGCDEKSQARVPGGRLDPTMLVELEVPPPHRLLEPIWVEPVRGTPPDSFGIDKVPI
jgi:hypothetical protein